MISCYTTLFNLDVFSFNIDEIMSNWLYYFDEIVVATNETEKTKVRNLFKEYSSIVKVVSHSIDFSNQRWDGLLKDLALKNCSNEIVFQLDADERLSGDRSHLYQLCEALEKERKPSCLMIENIDLYDDLDHYRSSGAKWYLHTKTGSNRGVVNFAKIDETNFDPEKSDGCELICDDGNLVPCLGLVSNRSLRVFHLGHINFTNRLKLNQLFWRDIWNKRKSISLKMDAQAEDVLVSISDMRSVPKRQHQLKHPLWPTI
jgi:hypothetical protein